MLEIPTGIPVGYYAAPYCQSCVWTIDLALFQDPLYNLYCPFDCGYFGLEVTCSKLNSWVCYLNKLAVVDRVPQTISPTFQSPPSWRTLNSATGHIQWNPSNCQSALCHFFCHSNPEDRPSSPLETTLHSQMSLMNLAQTLWGHQLFAIAIEQNWVIANNLFLEVKLRLDAIRKLPNLGNQIRWTASIPGFFHRLLLPSHSFVDHSLSCTITFGLWCLTLQL
jgi:hypothetical protein